MFEAALRWDYGFDAGGIELMAVDAIRRIAFGTFAPRLMIWLP